ncbi:hypothetical protein [Desulfosporosinus sp. OT]|uniref:hypothetical protein n=1 Tax=Desulfosporosinus sp. OT TaxID=913865 RepID=UPI000223A80B|nr:hypothetical protein [Desulfosporosinus sp. OT]EGW36354.1 hypothetical protein DOT_5758 [Desulfosporosinus sp. OT]
MKKIFLTVLSIVMLSQVIMVPVAFAKTGGNQDQIRLHDQTKDQIRDQKQDGSCQVSADLLRLQIKDQLHDGSCKL